MDDANPTARALQCLSLLQDHPGITAQRLGDRLGVSDRAARRYVSILRGAGVAVDSVTGPYGGYRIGRSARRTPLMLSTTETLGLVMAVLDGHHDPTATDNPVGSALGKLLRVLPEPVAHQAQVMRRTTAPAPDRGAARPRPEIAAALVTACADRRRARIGYRSEAGREWQEEVDPWALVVRHGRWYVLCWSHRAGDRRSYRIDRVTSVVALDAGFTPPDDLDPVTDLEAQLGAGWEYEAEVLLDAPMEEVARALPRHLGRLEPAGPDRCRLVGSTSNPAMYAEQLAAAPTTFTIVRGDEVREAARELGRRLLAAVGSAQV
jgi:predicted DNA-binding transcriptional regulator YafY